MRAFLHAASISLFISLLNDMFEAVPWHQSCILRKWLDLEVRYARCSKKSCNTNTHITATSFTAAEVSRIDWDSCEKRFHKVRTSGLYLLIHSMCSWNTPRFPIKVCLSAVYLSKHDLKSEQSLEASMELDTKVTVTDTADVSKLQKSRSRNLESTICFSFKPGASGQINLPGGPQGKNKMLAPTEPPQTHIPLTHFTRIHMLEYLPALFWWLNRVLLICTMSASYLLIY